MNLTDQPPVTPPIAGSNPRLAEAVEEYRTLLKSGQPLDRAAFRAAHVDLGPALIECLDALDFLEAAGPALHTDGAVGPNPGPDWTGDQTALGDFRIIREVGRGGMGVVYEAEQMSLGRRVALKVLPFAATMDSRQLQRFKNEAHAAAQLHHTNIVPVHYVGCERGVHFYAMQFIEGESLSDVIADLRTRTEPRIKTEPRPLGSGEPAADPTTAYTPFPDGRGSESTTPIAALSTVRSTKDSAFFRTVAELGIQAAEALDYAHEHGIIHRDIKPANLLIDAESRLWITDFGLAQIQGDARMTMTGDLVGTLRYMSPEQALAKRVVVDHRTDIYSLGVTLYEMLTLEPAYRGNDRQELLRQIAFEEPRRLRRLTRSIPAEMETIVQKAMEKNAADRYATAKEIADDLRRFMMDEPIRARRPGVVQRARKWGRRHQAAATAAVVCLLVTLGVTLASMGWVLGDRNSRKRQAEEIVLEALEAAKPGLEQGNPWDHALVSALRQAEAQTQSGLLSPESKGRVEQLQKDVKMLAELERIALEPAVRAGSYHFFDSSGWAEAYKQAFEAFGIDVLHLEPGEAVRLLQGSAIRKHLGAALYEWAGSLSKNAVKQVDPRAERIRSLARDVDPFPWVEQLREPRASGDNEEFERLLLARPIDKLSQTAIDRISRAILPTVEFPRAQISPRLMDFLRQAQALYPANFWTNYHLASALHILQPPRLEEAVGFSRAAVALRPDSPGGYVTLGAALLELDRLDEAIAANQKAIALQPSCVQAHINLGIILSEKGMNEDAIAEYRKAIELAPDYAPGHLNLASSLLDKELLDEAIAECRKAIELEPDSGAAYSRLGNALSRKGRLDEAIDACRKAIELKQDLAEAHHYLGLVLSDGGKLDEAIAEGRKAIELKPNKADYYIDLGNALCAKGQLDEAIAACRKAIELKPRSAAAHLSLGNPLSDKGKLDEAIAEYRKAVELRADLAMPHNNLGFALLRKGKPDEAIAECRKAIELEPNLGMAHSNLGNALADKGKLDEALAEHRKAVELEPGNAASHYNLGIALANNGTLYEAITEYRKAIQLNPNYALARSALDKALLWIELDTKLAKILKGELQPADVAERTALAELCGQPFKKLYVTSYRFYADAFAADPQLADDLDHEHRYNAACAAANAGCGQGKDADQTDDKERPRIRRQALEWLRADLAAYRQMLDKDPDKTRPIVVERMANWQQDTDFAGVREMEGLAKLPEAERVEWSKLWQDVAALGKQAAEAKGAQPAPAMSPELVPPPKEVPAK